MIRSVYQTAMGMLVQQKKQENHAHNLANVETAGYKAKTLAAEASFSETLVNHGGGGNGPVILGQLPLGVRLSGYEVQWKQGTLIETGNSMDFALEGEGFFAFESSLGMVLARNGELHQNSEGVWVDKSGYPLLCIERDGSAAPIQTLPGEKWSVGSEGDLLVDGSFSGKIMVLKPEDPSQLVLLDGGYVQTPANNLTPSIETWIHQGSLESSNVDSVSTMVDLMATGRLLQSQQKVLNTLDETLNRAVNEIGKL
jgi:flagellar basal-body rod protein FlgG